MQSNRVRLMLVALFSALALGALTAAAAQAVEAPRWSIGGTDLAEGKTHYISAKAYRPFIIEVAGARMECTVVKLKEGALLGSAAGNAGKDNEVIEFETCTVSGTFGGQKIEKCTMLKPIVTRAIKSELVEAAGAKPEEKKGSLLTLFTPAEGSTFATFEFSTGTGGHCPPSPTSVTGQLLGQVLTDPNTPPTLGTLVTLESGATEATSGLINFPTTPITKYIRISGGKVGAEETVKQFTALSEAAALEGTVLVTLAKKNTTTGLLESEPTATWSALP